MTDFTIKVPATTANMGPGLDCLGMALDIWNTISVKIGESGMEIRGEGKDTLQNSKSNLVLGGFKAAHESMGVPLTPVEFICENFIPISRGLGSSAAAIVSGLVAGNHVLGDKLNTRQILKLATDIEGHPDNVAPAILGGCQIVVANEEDILTSNIPTHPTMRVVMFIPNSSVSTKDGRSVLGGAVARVDAIHNLSRVALLVNTLQSGDLSNLYVATKDRLHQPARQRVFPAMRPIMNAATQAGALGVFLSGSGPTILALCAGREVTVGYEMTEAASKSGVDGSIRISVPSKLGAHITP
jgi:homoserine kinase